MITVEEAKDVLTAHGYCVDALWSSKDLTDRFNCDDDAHAQELVNNAINAGPVIERIFDQIEYLAQQEGYEEK